MGLLRLTYNTQNHNVIQWTVASNNSISQMQSELSSALSIVTKSIRVNNDNRSVGRSVYGHQTHMFKTSNLSIKNSIIQIHCCRNMSCFWDDMSLPDISTIYTHLNLKSKTKQIISVIYILRNTKR